MSLTDNDQIKNKCPHFSVYACVCMFVCVRPSPEATVDPSSSEWPELSNGLIPKAVVGNKTTMGSKCNNNLLLESESELEAQKRQLPFPENIDPEPEWRRVRVLRVSLKPGGAGVVGTVTGWGNQHSCLHGGALYQLWGCTNNPGSSFGIFISSGVT